MGRNGFVLFWAQGAVQIPMWTSALVLREKPAAFRKDQARCNLTSPARPILDQNGDYDFAAIVLAYMASMYTRERAIMSGSAGTSVYSDIYLSRKTADSVFQKLIPPVPQHPVRYAGYSVRLGSGCACFLDRDF